MSLTVIPNSLLLPFEAVSLGRLVTSIDQPLEGYHKPPFAEAPKPIPSIFDYAEHSQQDSRASFTSSVTALLSLAFSKRSASQIRIEPRCFKTYAIDNSDAWFDEAISHAETKKWIEKTVLKGKKIYMIVGFCTLTETQFGQTSLDQQEVQGQMTAPLSLSLTAAGVILPFANRDVDPSIQGDFGRLASNSTRIVARGEQICTIKYREVGHKWLSSRLLENLKLSKPRQWSCMVTRRYTIEDEHDEDVIEVDLKDASNLGDEWTAAESKEGLIYVRS
ncbi:hypothetical protein B0A48_18736 [Cryoendolithus antarcticus]|uniref:Uncharacterized protein n=1 Tax=Cryoendolithus antarcticus TaxID=1507870 RepID=A0A1V8S8V5_9PEZI|nr:hypothetical protein B0A48_18736 [Cryoendolithus antarcticus]